MSPGAASSYGAQVRVEVVRSGGFAGRVLRWSVVVEELPDPVASEVRALLDDAPSWPEEPSAGAPAGPLTGRPGGVPDGFRWRVLTDAPAQGLEVAFSEPPPEPAQRLLDLVRGSADGGLPGPRAG